MRDAWFVVVILALCLAGAALMNLAMVPPGLRIGEIAERW